MKKTQSFEIAVLLLQINGYLLGIGCGVVLIIVIFFSSLISSVPYTTNDYLVNSFLLFAMLFFIFSTYILSKYVKQGENWARICGIILGFLYLLEFPIGTIAGVFIIYGLTKGYKK